jgi:hypothetical protein
MMRTSPPYLKVLPAGWRFDTQTISPVFQEKVRPFATLFAGG